LRERLNPAERRELISVARASIARGLESGQPLSVRAQDYPPALQAPLASFVTLEIEHRLRGCIGSLEVRLPLVDDVALHAYEAAFRDPRFPPVTNPEIGRLSVHISVLSPHEPLEFEDEADLARQLRPGRDGLVIARGPRRATFLPAVWKSLPDPAEFLAQLKIKAGISTIDGGGPLAAWRYTVEELHDPASPAVA
jgi:AmmeMemoRadiSam system protein A